MSGGKINNTQKYPKRDSGTILNSDWAIGSAGDTKETIGIPVGAMFAALLQGQTIEVTLENATTYQNDDLISATGYLFVHQGNELSTKGYISSFDNETGTITFNTDYGQFNGLAKILYW